MAFETFVKCDRDGCNSRAQVPQQGAFPTGWVAIRYLKPSLEKNQMEQATVTLCSWKCAFHFAKQFVVEEPIAKKAAKS